MVKLRRDAGATTTRAAKTATATAERTTAHPQSKKGDRFSVHAHRRRTLLGGGRTSFNALSGLSLSCAALQTDKPTIPAGSSTNSLVDITERIEDIIGKPVKKERAFAIPVIDRLSELKDHELNFGALALTFSAAVYEARVDNVGDKAHQALAIIGGGYASAKDGQESESGDDGMAKGGVERPDKLTRGRTKRDLAGNGKGTRLNVARTLIPKSESARITRTATHEGPTSQQRDPFFAKTVKAVDFTGGDFLRIIPSRVTRTTVPVVCNNGTTGCADMNSRKGESIKCKTISSKCVDKGDGENSMNSSSIIDDDDGSGCMGAQAVDDNASIDKDNDASSSNLNVDDNCITHPRTLNGRKRSSKERPFTRGLRKSRRSIESDTENAQNPSDATLVDDGSHRNTASVHIKREPVDNSTVRSGTVSYSSDDSDTAVPVMPDTWDMVFVTSGRHPAFDFEETVEDTTTDNGNRQSMMHRSFVAVDRLAGFLARFADPTWESQLLLEDQHDPASEAEALYDQWVLRTGLCEPITALKTAMSAPLLKQQEAEPSSTFDSQLIRYSGSIGQDIDTGTNWQNTAPDTASSNEEMGPVQTCEDAFVSTDVNMDVPTNRIGFGSDGAVVDSDALGAVVAHSIVMGTGVESYGCPDGPGAEPYRLDGDVEPPVMPPPFGEILFQEGENDIDSEFTIGHQYPMRPQDGDPPTIYATTYYNPAMRVGETTAVGSDTITVQSDLHIDTLYEAYTLPYAEMDLTTLAATIRKGRTAAVAQRPKQQRRVKSPTTEADTDLPNEVQLIMDFATVSLTEELTLPTEEERAKAKRSRGRRAAVRTTAKGNLGWLTTEDNCVPTVAFKLHSILNFSLVQGITALPRLSLFQSHPYFSDLGDGVRGSAASFSHRTQKTSMSGDVSQGHFIGSPEIAGVENSNGIDAIKHGADTLFPRIDERDGGSDDGFDAEEQVDQLIFNEHENLDTVGNGNQLQAAAAARIKEEYFELDKSKRSTNVPVYGIDFGYPFLRATKFVDVQRVKNAMKEILSNDNVAPVSNDVNAHFTVDDRSAVDSCMQVCEPTLEELYNKTHTRIQDQGLSFHRFFVLALHLCNETDSCIMSADQSATLRGNSLSTTSRFKKGFTRVPGLDAENAVDVDCAVMCFHAAAAFHF